MTRSTNIAVVLHRRSNTCICFSAGWAVQFLLHCWILQCGSFRICLVNGELTMSCCWFQLKRGSILMIHQWSNHMSTAQQWRKSDTVARNTNLRWCSPMDQYPSVFPTNQSPVLSAKLGFYKCAFKSTDLNTPAFR